MNHSSCRNARRRATYGCLSCVALGAVAAPHQALAEFLGQATATGQFEHDSNLFAQPAHSILDRSVSTFIYGAELDGIYRWSRQEFYTTAIARQFDYQSFSEFNHTEYDFDAGLRWQLGDLLNGNVEVTRTRAMVPFLDLTGTAVTTLSILTTQQESFDIGLKLSSEWKLEGSAVTSQSNQPVQGAPNQELTQSTGTASILYAGIGPLTTGVTVSYLSGEYNGAIGASNGLGLGLVGASNSSYKQYTAGGTASYQLSRTSFQGTLGYSDRTSDTPSNDASGISGSINFRDQLTPKTGFTIKVARAINTYYLNLGAEVDTDAGVDVNWQATRKIAVAVGYLFTYRQFARQVQAAGNGDTVDHQQTGTISISYKPDDWLTVSPYANVQTRSSNTFGRAYNSTIYGITLTATVGNTGARAKK